MLTRRKKNFTENSSPSTDPRQTSCSIAPTLRWKSGTFLTINVRLSRIRDIYANRNVEARPMTRNVRHFLTRQSVDENNILQSLCICITRDECRQVWLADWVYRGRAPRNRYAFVSAENPEIDGLSRAADAAAGMVWRVVARVNQPLS